MAVYGIDLGTTYSCIVRNDGAGSVAPVDLTGANGRKFIPSVVYYEKNTGQPKVGAIGKASMLTRPECTKAFVKREMDKQFCDTPIVVGGKKRKLSPVEASACILYHLVNGANKVEKGAGRKEIHQAVITIPAKFNEQQRARTKLAAELAGIEVLGLLQEPTAAAIAYDIPAGCTVLVFDLGGGTLDVSIVTNDKGDYKVVGTPAGNDQLGGMDWDEALVKLCFQKAGKKVDKSDAMAWNRMMGMAENIKQALTEETSVIDDEVEGGNIINDCEIEVNRSEFENVCKDLLDKSIAVVDKAIASAKAQNPKLKIDFFLTVGGSSRMPMIRKTLSKKYGAEYGKGKAEDEWLRINNPDTAIAIGAAKYAQMLSKGSNAAVFALNNLKAIEDKATHSYGILIYDKDQGKNLIKNVVKSSDSIVYQHEFRDLFFRKTTRYFDFQIYENEEDESYTEENDPHARIISSHPLDLGSVKEKGTPIKLSINRDKDGLIYITFECDGYKTTVEANPKESLIDEETRKNIETSIGLMG